MSKNDGKRKRKGEEAHQEWKDKREGEKGRRQRGIEESENGVERRKEKEGERGKQKEGEKGKEKEEKVRGCFRSGKFKREGEEMRRNGYKRTRQ